MAGGDGITRATRRLDLSSLCALLEQRGELVGISAGDWTGIEVNGISFDFQPIVEGTIYVNLHGDSAVARERMRFAAQRGVCGMICEFSPPIDLPAPVLRVRRPRIALSAAAAALEGFPSEGLTIIGITGTNGKSTLCCMLARILEMGGVQAGLVSSVGERIGRHIRIPDFITTPDAPCLQRTLREIRESGATHAIVEVTSHGLAHERVADVRFDVGAIVNLDRDHIDFHHDEVDYRRSKARLFHALPKSGFSFYPTEDPHTVVAARETCATTVGIGPGPTSDIRVDSGRLVVPKSTARSFGRDRAEISIRHPLPGRHQTRTAALAAALGYQQGVAIQAIEQALATMSPLHRRLQVIYEGAFTILDDTACNPGHLRVLIDWLEAHRGRFRSLVALTCARGSRGPQMNFECADLIAKTLPGYGLRSLILSDCAGAANDFRRVHPDEQQAFEQGLGSLRSRMKRFTTNEEAARYALRVIRRDELLMVFGTVGLDNIGGMLLAEVERARHRRGFPRRIGTLYETDPVALLRRIVTVPQREGGG